MRRASGILMHISSLANDYGIGTFGKSAYQFADFLKESGQSYWQILPLGHTGYGDSPYQSFSAYAGNPYFIDFELLEKEGLLERGDFEDIDFGFHYNQVDYGKLFENKYKILSIAYQRCKSQSQLQQKILEFKEKNEWWLEDYALYMAIKYKMQLKSWQEWDEPIKLRDKDKIAQYKVLLKEEIDYWVFIQYHFFKQWYDLKTYTNNLGIEIIGDLPIYVAADSADAWANPELFKLDEHKVPLVVAGCPPDAFSETGQLWGNPIYDWKYLEKSGYDWWVSRIKDSFECYDIVRIDHFRGFESYWEIPFGEETAQNGKWVKGPGIKLFDEIHRQLGELEIIAEDLGYLTQDVLDFRDETGYKGMKVLQFAFNPYDESAYLPHNYPKNCIVYTGTHDNDTVMGWVNTASNQHELKYATQYLKLDEEEGYNWGMIRGAWSSTAEIAIAPMQDFLGLGTSARMNTPSALGGNWQWRMDQKDLTPALSDKIYQITKCYRRV